MEPIRVLLVDDNVTFLRIATLFLQQYPEVSIVGTADGGFAALRQARDLKPQLILLDLVMPDLAGLKVIPLLRAGLPQMGIIALTLHETDGYRQAALAAGADAFVTKRTLSAELLPAIRRVYAAKSKT